MIRLIAVLILAFLVPFVLHGLLTLLRGRGFVPLPTSLRGKLWLIAAGLVLAVITLVSLMGQAPRALGERYIPAHLENGVLVPERFEKAQ